MLSFLADPLARFPLREQLGHQQICGGPGQGAEGWAGQGGGCVQLQGCASQGSKQDPAGGKCVLLHPSCIGRHLLKICYLQQCFVICDLGPTHIHCFPSLLIKGLLG